MQQHYKKLWAYDKWATETLLQALEQHTPANQNIYILLSHCLSASRIWLDRCKGLPHTEDRFKARTLAEIKTDLENYNHEWVAYIDSIPTDAFAATINYTTIAGQPFKNVLNDIITHVINHGTHHRGAVIALMKAEGYTLPLLDYIVFVR